MNEGNKRCLYITSIDSGKKLIFDKLLAFSSRLYHMTINLIKSYVVVNQKFNDPKICIIWHDMLGHHESSIMRRIIEYSQGHPLKNLKRLFCPLNTYMLLAHKVN